MSFFSTANKSLENNIAECNKGFQKVLYCSFAVPLVFLVLIKHSLLYMPFEGFFAISAFVMVVNIIEYFLNRDSASKNPVLQNISMYFGLISICLVIGMAGSFSIVPFYFAYAMPAIFSSVYLRKDVTNFISIFGFIVMLLSFWLKTYHLYLVSKNTGLVYPHQKAYIILIVGLTLEYIFAYLVALALSTKSSKILKNFSSNLLTKQSLLQQLEESTEILQQTKEKRSEYNEKIQENQLKTIEFVAEVLGTHDLFIGNHLEHTRAYVVMICEELYSEGLYMDILSEETISLFSSAAFLHDIGKIHLPESILNTPKKYTTEEYDIMKTHTTEGKKLLSLLPKINDGYFNEIATQMAYSHHERWDGLGYPEGLKGDEIPLPARIMAAADVLDALISFRFYKKAMTIDEAMQVFIENEGAQFEPCIAEAVVKCRDKIDYINREFMNKEKGSNAEGLKWWQSYHRDLTEDLSESFRQES